VIERRVSFVRTLASCRKGSPTVRRSKLQLQHSRKVWRRGRVRLHLISFEHPRGVITELPATGAAWGSLQWTGAATFRGARAMI
jgi:hypothetical protein